MQPDKMSSSDGGLPSAGSADPAGQNTVGQPPEVSPHAGATPRPPTLPVEKSLIDHLGGWPTVISGVVAALGIAGWVLLFLSPVKQVHLTNRTERKVPIGPLPEGRPAALGLQYQGKPIERALLIQLTIENTGWSTIGEKDKQWRLDLRGKDGWTIFAAGDPSPSYGHSAVKLAPQPAANVIRLEVGHLNAGDTFRQDVIVIDPDEDLLRPIQAETDIPGLKPDNTDQNLHMRIANAIFYPVLGVSVLAFAAGLLLHWKLRGQVRTFGPVKMAEAQVVRDDVEKKGNPGCMFGLLLVYVVLAALACSWLLGLALVYYYSKLRL